MTHPRGLTAEEADAWETLAATVEPLHPADNAEPSRERVSLRAKAQAEPAISTPGRRQPPERPMPRSARAIGQPAGSAGGGNLDSHWDRKLKSGAVAPDFTLDLHGHTLDQAHDRLESGLFQAKAMGARLVLLIAGKSRPVDAADRGSRRGAIRAKILDWLAAGPHGTDIAAIRKAHRRHGGEGALYLVLKRRR